MAVLFFLFGAFLLYQAMQLPLRSFEGGPGPGLLPAALGVLMVGFSATQIPGDLRQRPWFGNLFRVAITIGAVAVYGAFLEALGFIISTAILMVLLMVVYNERYRGPLAALGIAGTLATYALFYVTLKVQLPGDPWNLWR